MSEETVGRLHGELFTECAEWIWEQLQEEGFLLAGELVELILSTERDLRVQGGTLDAIAAALEGEFRARGIAGNPYPVEAALIKAVLEWEDEFLGYAGIPRSES
jgi:hypothetical protein